MAAIPSRSGFGPIHFTLIFSIKSVIFHTLDLGFIWLLLWDFSFKKVRIIHQKILTTSFDKVDSLISLVFGPVLPTSKVRNFFHTAAPVTFVFYDIVKWKLSLPFLSTLLIVQLSICRLVLLSYRNNEAEISHEIEIVVSHGSRGEKFRG